MKKSHTFGMLMALGAVSLFPGTSHATITYLGKNYEQATFGSGTPGFGNPWSFSFAGAASGISGSVVAAHIDGGLGNGTNGIVGTHNPTGSTNFPSDSTGPNYDLPYYAPTTFETNRAWLNVQSNRAYGTDVHLIRLTWDLAGNTATDRFIFDFLNLDNASGYFVSAKDIYDNVYTGAALKAVIGPYLGNYGSPQFEHDSSGTYYTVNSTPINAFYPGLEDSDGNNEHGGGGSVVLNIPLKQLVLEFNDIEDSIAGGDGFQMTVMTALVPEPATFTTGLIGLSLLGLREVRRRRKRKAAAAS